MPNMPPAAGRTERILVRGVNWLGDAVMSTPALQRLREARPDARITLLAHAKLADLWQGHPAVDVVQSFAGNESVWSIGRRLKADQFDWGLILPNSPRSALELWLGGVRERVGYAGAWRNWFLTRAVSPRPGVAPMRKRSRDEIDRLIREKTSAPTPAPPSQAHHIFQYLHLAAALGAQAVPVSPNLFVSPGEIEAAKTKFGLLKSGALIFGLCPGAEYGPAKRWPPQSFLAAAVEIQKRMNCVWLLLGGPGDVQVASRIESEFVSNGNCPACINLAGKTSLRELMALLKLCRVLLTNDSGPMHVAAALGTPVVVPFGSTSPELTGPGLPGDSRHQLLRANAPCAPCFRRECPIDFRCMTGITVEQVVAAALRAVG